MSGDVDNLTEREKEVLRLLASSHDAKSAAARLGLSVHTINERLRTARRKLGVSSSRAAARLLAEAETDDYQNFVDKDFREAPVPPIVNDAPLAAPRPVPSQGWLIGGLLMLVVALSLAIILTGLPPTDVVDGGDDAPTPEAAVPPALSSPATRPVQALAAQATQSDGAAPAPQTEERRDASHAAAAALAWLALVDRGDWNASWRTASSTFQERMSQEAWAARAAQLDRPAGRLVRVRQYAARSASAGTHTGGSMIVQYQGVSDTDARILETVALVPDDDGWKVSAYFTHGSPPGPAARPTP